MQALFIHALQNQAGPVFLLAKKRLRQRRAFQ